MNGRTNSSKMIILDNVHREKWPISRNSESERACSTCPVSSVSYGDWKSLHPRPPTARERRSYSTDAQRASHPRTISSYPHRHIRRPIGASLGQGWPLRRGCDKITMYVSDQFELLCV